MEHVLTQLLVNPVREEEEEDEKEDGELGGREGGREGGEAIAPSRPVAACQPRQEGPAKLEIAYRSSSSSFETMAHISRYCFQIAWYSEVRVGKT